MGLLDGLLGDGSNSQPVETDDEDDKYAIVLNAGPDKGPVAGNAFKYAVEFDENGHDVQLFLDGKATKWPGEYAENPDKPFNYDWEQVRSRGLLAGACGYCANAFGASEACERADVPVLSDEEAHAPSVAELANNGYEILTVG